jgi:catechol 2,3-dioxygenase-like lactoylglutathione lyase family enzyme
MGIKKLAHFAIRTVNLEGSKSFYVNVIGLKEGFRPAFNFPGAWLYQGDDVSDYGVVHLIGLDRSDPAGLKDYLGDRGEDTLLGSASIDHIAFLAEGLEDVRSRLSSRGLAYRERTVPTLGLHQVFVEDPSGITVELNFAAEEANKGQAR